ncbi:MAG: alkaline phosphatase, partial [Leptothrix sp. (in: b-proteobacteria)]
RLRSSDVDSAGHQLPHARLTRDPYTLGIASGQPRPGSVVLWTRLAPQPHAPGGGMDPRPVRMRWQVAHDPTFSRIAREGEVTARPELAHSVRVTVDRLTPGRVWYYRFITDGIASPVGRTRTAPPLHSDPARLRLALASCQHYEHGHYAAHREIAQTDLDLVLFVGDYIYDSSNPNFLRRPHEAGDPFTLDDYRARHATYKLDLNLQAAHAAHPWIVTWDDHEARNDYASAWATADLSAAEFVQVRAAAYQAYFEHLPLAADQLPGAAGTPGAVRMQDRHSWGRLADIWTLDNRQHRSLHACARGNVAEGHLLWHCAELADPGRTMWGAAQEQWLQQGLSSSPRRWKLIAQATQMSACGLAQAGQQLINSDGWDGYPAARTRLLQHLADTGTQNAVVLSGDVHRHAAANLRLQANDPRSAVLASEFVTTSITSRGMAQHWMELIQRSNPDLLHARSDERGYSLIEISNQSLHWIARATAFPVTEDAVLTTQASYTVEAGRAGPQAG